MKSIKRILLAASIVTGAVLCFCSFSTGLKKPDIKYEKFEVKKVTFRDTTVNFIYSVNNPNPVGLKNISVSYKLYLDCREKPRNAAPFASGSDVKFDIKSRAVSPFVLPLTVNYEGFFKTAAKLTKTVLGGKKTIPFVLDTTFTLNLKILKFSIPVESKGELPLPDIKGSLIK